nr:two-pore potassium channel 5 [Tanacetum cinerariifolium]
MQGYEVEHKRSLDVATIWQGETRFFNVLMLPLAEARIDMRHMRVANWVLQREITVKDLLDADMNNNGFLIKFEYLVFKLKEIGKIDERDILQICNQFRKVDSSNSGYMSDDAINGSWSILLWVPAVEPFSWQQPRPYVYLQQLQFASQTYQTVYSTAPASSSTIISTTCAQPEPTVPSQPSYNTPVTTSQ